MTLRLPSFNPREVPVERIDSELTPLPETWLAPDALRLHFQTVPLAAPERPGDGGRVPQHLLRSPRAAAVLVPLVMREHGVQVLLTRRTDHLKDHAGQISFPGGRVEVGDTDVWATARRESLEEIGLPATFIEPIGLLPTYATVTAYSVTPCVALVRSGFSLALEAGEVAEAFEVPLAFLMNPAHHRWHRLSLLGFDRQFLSMPWTSGGREHFIWGATAAMLRNLYHQLRQGRETNQ